MEHPIVVRAEEFIWKNARLLERRRFARRFKGGSRQDALNALFAYQNSDGGFGNALEPDIRCPDSQPVAVQHALEFLDEAGMDRDAAQAACDYLQTVATDEGGVPWMAPSAHAYPRAPWWNTVENPPASLNPTAGIAGLLHKNSVKHEWLERATRYCWSKIDELQSPEMHEAGAALTFLYYAPDRERAERTLAQFVKTMFDAGLVADASDAGYVRKPLDWSPEPRHPLRRYFSEEAIEANLLALAQGQKEDGGWSIPWEAISPACELEWRGWVTLSSLITLADNGYFDTH